MKKTTAQIIREELKRARLDTVAENVDLIKDAAKIIRENEQNLKDLGGLKNRLDILDKIFVTVDKIAGDAAAYREQQELNSNTLSAHNDRIEKVEKHLHISPSL